MRHAVGSLLVLAALAGAAWAGEPDAKPGTAFDVVVAKIAGSRVTVSFRLPGYAADADATLVQRSRMGDKVVLVGSGFASKATVSLIVEKDEPHVSSAEWRARFSRGQGKMFEVGDVACVDRSGDAGSAGRANFSAVLAAGGYCFDLHVSATAGTAPLTRDSFTEIAKSLRVVLLRRGEIGDYPDDVLALDDAAARRMPDHVAFLAAEAKARPSDYVPPFVLGELMQTLKAPDADCVAPYSRALTLLDKRSGPARAEQFVRAVAEDGLGRVLLRAGRCADAVPHLQRGLDTASRLNAPFRAGVAYNLACALAKKGDTPRALDAVRLAIEASPDHRASAAKDDDLASLRTLPAFQLMTTPVGDEGPPPADVATASVPKTGVRISMRIPGAKDRGAMIPVMEAQGWKDVILAVVPGPSDSQLLWVSVRPDAPHATSADRRASVFGSNSTPFETGDVACVEIAAGNYAAFPVAGGFWFQVVAASEPPQAISRAAFAEIIKSFRACCLTASTPSEYPPEVLECMNGAAVRMPDAWLDWIDAEAKARPDDYVPPFVRGETLSFLRRPAAECVGPYTNALTLLDKRKDATRPLLFVRMLCEDNLGGALSDAGDIANALLHAQRATEAAKAIASPLHGRLAFRLARWLAKKGDTPKSIEALRAAIETMPSLRDTARTEVDLKSLRDLPDFKALVGSTTATK